MSIFYVAETMLSLINNANMADTLTLKIELVQKDYDITVINPLTNKPAYDLNPALIIKNKLTRDEVKQLLKLHQSKIVLFNEAEKETDKTKLQAWVLSQGYRLGMKVKRKDNTKDFSIDNCYLE